MSSIITGQTSRLSIESREEKMNIRTYKAKTKWIEGNKAETEIREFKVRIDEPVELRGTNTAPQPGRITIGCLRWMCSINLSGLCKKIWNRNRKLGS